uniref:CSON004998 protein n=1 Tax=Culicoides sonorensis TaxID=179676 RepID=A0A336N240_CULSO
MSVSGKDPKVRPGAVDVCRYWQDLGYLLIYITGRPDMQQQKVMAWLSQHNFPYGLLSFADGLSADPLGHKRAHLIDLIECQDIIISYAYGSNKDIAVYNSIGLKPKQIFTVGKVNKKLLLSTSVITDGYVAHLSQLRLIAQRPVHGNARMMIPRDIFRFPTSSIRQQR